MSFVGSPEGDEGEEHDDYAGKEQCVCGKISCKTIFIDDLAVSFDYGIGNKRCNHHGNQHVEDDADALKLASGVLGIKPL